MYQPRFLARCGRILPVTLAMLVGFTTFSPAAHAQNEPLIKRLVNQNEKLEITVNSSRILELDSKIPRALVNDPEVLSLTPLSPNQIQVAGRKPGVTQVNLWDENDQIYTVDVVVLGDAAELEAALQTLYPNSSTKVYRYSNSLVLDGFVDRPDRVNQIVRLAEDYAPKVINNISVGGVQQILLNVQVYEVSRTKLRRLGMDFASISNGDFFISSISGLLSVTAAQGGSAITSQGDTLRFGFVDGNNSFFAFLDALRQNDMMKVLAEPKLVTTSGRPASFISGGEFPVLVPQSLGTVSIEYKKFGTQVDFLPVVLGNGKIRLEVRPRVSEIDNTRSVVIDSFTVPGLRIREVDTAVEMEAGQTLALAGLIQSRVEAKNRGIPWLAEMPWVGAAFRRVEETNNEVELLILVRPELIDPLDPYEVPPCLPGMGTTSPNDVDLFWRGHLEVPSCNGCGATDCKQCHPDTDEAIQGPTGYQQMPYGEEVQGIPQASRRQPAPRAVAKAAPRLPSAQARPQIPTARYDRQNPVNSTSQRTAATAGAGKKPTLIGPVGYEVK